MNKPEIDVLLAAVKPGTTKSVKRLAVLMVGLANIDWDRVKEFNLTWEEVNGEWCPNLKMIMKDNVFTGGNR